MCIRDRASGVDLLTKDPLITGIRNQFDTGQWNSMSQIDSHQPARLINLAQVFSTIGSRLQLRQMIAETPTPTSLERHFLTEWSLLFSISLRCISCFITAGPNPTLAGQLAWELTTTFGAGNFL